MIVSKALVDFALDRAATPEDSEIVVVIGLSEAVFLEEILDEPDFRVGELEVVAVVRRGLGAALDIFEERLE